MPVREPTIRIGLLLAIAALAACGKDEPPAPMSDEELLAEPAPAVAVDPAATPVAATETATVAADTAAPAATPKMLQPTPRTITPEEVGNTPVANIQEAFGAAQKAITRYCEIHSMPCDSFYIKETNASGADYTVTFFGAPNGQGMYLTAVVHADGSTEIAQ